MKEPIRVLQVVGKMHYGGMETLIMNVYRNIDREKVQFDFLVHYDEPGEYDAEIINLGGRIYHMPRTTPANYFKYKRALNAFFADHDEHRVIHGHLQSTAFLYHSAAKKYRPVCCITHAHSNGVDKSVKGRIVFNTSLKAEKYTDVFFACSKSASWFFFPKANKNGIPVKIIKNGIELQKYVFNDEIRTKYRDALKLNRKFTIGHVGRFAFAKNQEFLIDIFEKVYNKQPESILLLAGAGDDQEKIKEKVKALGLEAAVKFLGVRNDIAELMQAMDVFVLPSRYEGLSIALIEAQATGLKCFTSAGVVPSAANVTGTVNYISLNEPPEYWADEILKYSGGYERMDFSEKISNAGYNIKDTAKWLEEFYLKEYM